MESAPLPADEPRRLELLRQYSTVDPTVQQALDELVALIAGICRTPIALITLVDEYEQWFRSNVGLCLRGTPRNIAFCAYTILQKDPLVIQDTRQDPRFAGNPLVTGDPHIRFYAGAPLITPEGAALGSLCVLDNTPRELDPGQFEALRVLSRQAMFQLELCRRTRVLVESESRLLEVLKEGRRAELALQENEQRLRKLINGFSSSILAGLLMPDGTLVEVNRAAVAAFGLKREDIVGRRMDDISPWKDDPHTRQQLRAAISRAVRGISSRFDVQLTAPGNRMVDLDFSLEPVRDEDGNITFLVPSATIVTERKRAEQHVRQLNRVYALLSNISQTILREKNAQEILEAACNTAVNMGGFKMAWVGLRESTGYRLRIAAHAGADPDTVRTLQSLIKADRPDCAFTFRAITTGEHAICNDIAGDPLAADWREAALLRDYRAMVSLPLSPSGTTVGALNLYASDVGFFDVEEMRLLDELAMDISFALELRERERERLRVENALRDSESRFRQLAENIQEAFWMFDASQSKLLYISPAYEKIWGRSCASLYESPSTWWESVHPDDQEQMRPVLGPEARTTEFDATYRISRPDGSFRWVHTRAFPVRGEHGDTLRIVGISEDITERRVLEDQYRQSQKMEAIGQLAGGIAHDFNNILLVIRGFASLLAEEQQTPEAAEATRQIAQAAERAGNLTRQLLAFSRRQITQRRPLDLNLVVDKLNTMLRRILGEHVRLRIRLHPQPLGTCADSSLIEQVIMNLVVNARDAMPDGGEIVIATGEREVTAREAQDISGAKPGRYVVLEVSDNGSGIPPDAMPHIFEPFFTTKPQGKGTGLGLFTVYGIVTQHGGAIDVESTLGKGTRFEIRLPATELPAESAAPADSSLLPQGGHETILIVEDDPDVRRLTHKVLTRQGYRVLEAANGAEALESWESNGSAIDLLLTDMVMPGGMGGRELGERLRALKPGLRVIFTSGYSREMAGSELSILRGEYFIQKPSSISELLALVRRCLDAPARSP